MPLLFSTTSHYPHQLSIYFTYFVFYSSIHPPLSFFLFLPLFWTEGQRQNVEIPQHTKQPTTSVTLTSSRDMFASSTSSQSPIHRSMPQAYAEILNDLNQKVISAQPQDVLQFCANYFNQKLEEQRARFLATGKNNITARVFWEMLVLFCTSGSCERKRIKDKRTKGKVGTCITIGHTHSQRTYVSVSGSLFFHYSPFISPSTCHAFFFFFVLVSCVDVCAAVSMHVEQAGSNSLSLPPSLAKAKAKEGKEGKEGKGKARRDGQRTKDNGNVFFWDKREKKLLSSSTFSSLPLSPYIGHMSLNGQIDTRMTPVSCPCLSFAVLPFLPFVPCLLPFLLFLLSLSVLPSFSTWLAKKKEFFIFGCHLCGCVVFCTRRTCCDLIGPGSRARSQWGVE